MGSNIIKYETGKKFKNLLGKNLVKYSSKFLAHKKHLGHAGTSTNVLKNCINLSGFGVITRLFLHWKITKKISCQEKFAGF